MELNNEKRTKLQLEISVSELAYMLRIMQEIGIISNKSKTEIYKFCVENVQTKKAENISFNALKNKYNIPLNVAIIKTGKMIKELYSLCLRDQYKVLS